MSNRQLVLASHNPGKLREMLTLLGGLPFEIVPQSRGNCLQLPGDPGGPIQLLLPPLVESRGLAGPRAIAEQVTNECDGCQSERRRQPVVRDRLYLL